MKICLTSLFTREMEINTLVRDNLKPVSLAIVGKIENKKCWHSFGEIEILGHSWWESKWCSSYIKEYGVP